MEHFDALLALPVFRNSVLDWSIACATGAALFITLLAARRFVRRYHARLKRTDTIELLEVPVEALSATSVLFFLVVSLVAGLGTLSMSPGTTRVLDSALTLALFAQTGAWAGSAATLLLERRRRRVIATDRAIASSLGIIGFLVRTAIWAIIVLLALDNLGVDVTALVAGLGIGGKDHVVRAERRVFR